MQLYWLIVAYTITGDVPEVLKDYAQVQYDYLYCMIFKYIFYDGLDSS